MSFHLISSPCGLQFRFVSFAFRPSRHPRQVSQRHPRPYVTWCMQGWAANYTPSSPRPHRVNNHLPSPLQHPPRLISFIPFCFSIRSFQCIITVIVTCQFCTAHTDTYTHTHIHIHVTSMIALNRYTRFQLADSTTLKRNYSFSFVCSHHSAASRCPPHHAPGPS